MNFKSQYSLYSAVLCVSTTVILYCLNKYIYAWHRIILYINHKSLWYNNKSWTIIKLRIRETSSWLYKDPCQLVTSFHRVWLFLDIIPLDETICSKQELKRYSCPLSLFICGSHFRVWSITFKNISEELNGHNSCSWPNGATTLIRRYFTKVRIPLSKKPFEKLSVLKPMEFDRSMEHLGKWISFSKSDLLTVQKHVFAQHTNSARNFKNLIIKYSNNKGKVCTVQKSLIIKTVTEKYYTFSTCIIFIYNKNVNLSFLNMNLYKKHDMIQMIQH